MQWFVYGTLTAPDTAARVLDTYEFLGDATCHGLRRVNGEYPTLLPGGSVVGRLLQTPEVAALDRYEGVDCGLYVRVSLPTEDGKSVETYVGDPPKLGLEERWPGAGSLESRVRSYLADNDVVVSVE